MPDFTDFPSSWQTNLAKSIFGPIYVEVIFDPDGVAKAFELEHAISSMGEIVNVRDMNLEYGHRTTVQDIRFQCYDPDGFFSPMNSSGYFHDCTAELFEDHSSGTNQIKLRANSQVEFVADEELEITDGANTQALTVTSFTAASVNDYHLLVTDENLAYDFDEGSIVYTYPAERKEILCRLVLDDCTEKITVFRGRIIGWPNISQGRVDFLAGDLRKYLLKNKLIGADSDSDKKLMIMTADGLVSSVAWLTGWGAEPFTYSENGLPDGLLLNSETGAITGNAIESGLTTFEAEVTNSDGGACTATVEMLVDTNPEFDDDGTLGAFESYIPSAGPTIALNSDQCRFSMNGDFTFDYNADDAPQLRLTPDNIDTFCIEAKVTLNTIPAATEYKAGIGIILSAFTTSQKAYFLGYWRDNDEIFVKRMSIAGSVTVWDKSDYAGGNTIYLRIKKSSGVYYFYYKAAEIDEWILADNDSALVDDVLYVAAIAGTTTSTNLIIDFDYFKLYDGALAILSTQLSDGRIGESYSSTLVSDGGVGGYIYELDSGTLPAGLSLSSSGVLSGTPTTAREYTFTVKVTDANSDTDTQEFTVLINAASDIVLLPTTLASAVFGKSYTAQIICNATGSLDTSQVTILDNCRLGLWTIEFSDSENFTISGPGVTGQAGDINSTTTVQDQLEIASAAWSGSINAGDTLEFKTCISYEDENPVQIIYDLLLKADIDNHLIHCSSYFGDKAIGTLAEVISIGETGVDISVTAPTLIKTGETLKLGSETVTVTSGNSESSSYPPTITVTVSSPVNAHAIGEVVTWVERTALDSDFTYDYCYQLAENQGVKINHSFDREMDVLAAIETISAHFIAVSFADLWGVEHLHVIHPRDISTAESVAYNDSLLIGPIINSEEMVNQFNVKYGYDYSEEKYLYETSYPAVTANKSYAKNGFLNKVDVLLPGFNNVSYADPLMQRLYEFWCNGLKTVKIVAGIKCLLKRIGEVIEVDSQYPDMTFAIEITGLKIKIYQDIEIEITGYMYERIFDDYFLMDDSELDTGKLIW